MRRLLKYEWLKLRYSYSMIYACLICILSACITNFVIAGVPQSPFIYSVAFEFYIPQMLVFIIPSLFIAGGLRNGKVKTELLSGEKRYKIFIAKTIIYYFALFIIVNVYLLLLTFMNIKGIGIQVINGENSFVYFLRCASVGFVYCFMLSSILLFVSVLFKNPILTAIGSLVLFLIELLLKNVIDLHIADKIIPSLIVEQIIFKNSDATVIAIFVSMIVFVSSVSNVLSLMVYCHRNYK